MAAWLPPPLRQVAELPITEAALRAWMDLGESEYLDFKREWWQRSDSGKREFARDIAAFANAGGGAILVGITEGEQPQIVGVELQFDVEEWCRAVTGSRIEPPPRFSVDSVETESGTCIVVVVPPSADSPHAVSHNQQRLEYPVRNGTTKRYMREREVARAYERRLARFTSTRQQLEELHDRCRDELASLARARSAYAVRIVTVAAVPSVRGSIELRRGIAQEFDHGLRDRLTVIPTVDSREIPPARVGFQAVVISDRNTDVQLPLTHMELGIDAAGAISLGYPLALRNDIWRRENPQLTAWDAELFLDVYAGVHLLVEHASRSGSGGSLDVVASVAAAWGRDVDTAATGLPRFAIRPTGSRPQFAPTEPFPEVNGTPLVYRARGLDALAMDVVERLDLARELATALGSAFGIEECRQVTSDLEMNLAAFDGTSQRSVRSWAERNGIAIVGGAER